MRTLHLGLRVTDLARSLEFYRAVGYEVLGEVPETAFGGLTMLQLPGDEFVSIELVHDTSRGVVGPGGLNHLVVQVEELAATVAQLAGRAVVAEEPTSPDGAEGLSTTMFTDPDGCRIELVQWPPGHPAGIGEHDLSGSPS
jgi:lactoylglutathione lyase